MKRLKRGADRLKRIFGGLKHACLDVSSLLGLSPHFLSFTPFLSQISLLRPADSLSINFNLRKDIMEIDEENSGCNEEKESRRASSRQLSFYRSLRFLSSLETSGKKACLEEAREELVLIHHLSNFLH